MIRSFPLDYVVPLQFSTNSDALEWILLNKCHISFVCHILDDFLLIEPPTNFTPSNSACQQSVNSMLSIFKSIRIPVTPGKTQGPSQILEFMGSLLDTVKMKASLPPEKVEKLRLIFENFQQKRSCTLKQLQSLIGTLNFAK